MGVSVSSSRPTEKHSPDEIVGGRAADDDEGSDGKDLRMTKMMHLLLLLQVIWDSVFRSTA